MSPPPDFLYRVPIERDAPPPQPPFNYFSEFPVNGPPPVILNRAPVEKGARLQSFLKYPADEPPANSPTGPPRRVMPVL